MSIVGIGVDLSSEIITSVSTIPGCNYSNVRSEEQFRNILNTEFPYSVTAIGYNIEMSLSSQFELSKGYGTPDVNSLQKGGIAKFSSSFPSIQNSIGETRGGITLFRLQMKQGSEEKDVQNKQENKEKEQKEEKKEDEKQNSALTMKVRYEDATGIRHSDVKILGTPFAEDVNNNNNNKNKNYIADDQGFYSDSGIRKSILLVRYTDFCLEYTKRSKSNILELYAKLQGFAQYFQTEMTRILDDSLNQELNVLNSWIGIDRSFVQALRDQNNKSNSPNGSGSGDSPSPSPCTTSYTIPIKG